MPFNRIILNNLVTNEKYTRAVLPFLSVDYFSEQADKVVFEKINEFVARFNVCPTKEALAINVNNSNISEHVYEDVIAIIQGIEKDDNDYGWLVAETEQHCKRQALYNAMARAIDIADGNVKDVDPNIIPGLLMEALAVSFDTHVGHDYWDDAEEHWNQLHSPQNRHPFSLEILNKVTNKGIKDKTLNVVLAPINGGKSVHLIQQAADWLVRGEDVLYISMEMDETTCRERIDVVALDMTFDTVMALEKTQYMSRINNIRKKTQGRLMVKEYPAGSAHVGHFRHLLQELKIKKQFVPKMICIDYLTICASSKLPASAKGNTNTYYTSVAEEIRAFAQEAGIPVWTAVQFDRATQGASDAGLGNVGLAIGIAATADFMFAILIPEELAKIGQVIGKIVKNRYSSYKGKFILGLNPDKQQFYEIDQAAALTQEELEQLGLSTTIPSGGQNSNTGKVAESAVKDWNFG